TVPGLTDHLLVGLVVLAALVWTFVAIAPRLARQEGRTRVVLLAVPAILTVIVASWFAWNAVDRCAGAPGDCARALRDDLGVQLFVAGVVIIGPSTLLRFVP